MPSKRTDLPGGCWCSALTVFPSNWKESADSMKAGDWYISYRFYDSLHRDPNGNVKGHQRLIKGMNDCKKWTERKDATQTILEDEMELLQVEGYNPRTKKFTAPTYAEVDRYTPALDAFTFATGKLLVSAGVKSNLKSILVAVGAAMQILGLRRLTIGEVRRKHLKMIMEQVSKSNPRFSANTFNHYRKHLSMLFNELLEWDAVETNPVRDLKKQKHLVAVRQTLTDEERVRVKEHLAGVFPAFGCVVEMFYHSGIRLSELQALQVKHVDLVKERILVTVKKGRVQKQGWREIKTVAVPLWLEHLTGAAADDYVIGPGCRPGKQMTEGYLTDQWAQWVKNEAGNGKKRRYCGIGITADLYSVKHSHSTDVMDLLSDVDMDAARRAAAAHNGHTSTSMLDRHYDVKASGRRGKLVKMLPNEFVKKKEV